jgi:hypothetical protein
MERDAHLRSLFYLFSRVPNKGALSPGSRRRAPIKRDAPLPEGSVGSIIAKIQITLSSVQAKWILELVNLTTDTT